MLDYERPSEVILRDLIYVYNGVRLPEFHTKFGEPRPVDQRPEIKVDENTFIPIAVDEEIDARFDDIAGLMYRRTPINEVADDILILIDVSGFPFTLYEVLDQINVRLRLQLTEADVYDQTITSAEEPIRLKLKPGSQVFIGDSPILRTFVRVPLLNVLDLSGFQEYQAP